MRRRDEMVVVANMYPTTEGNETEVVKVENIISSGQKLFQKRTFKNSTPVSNELVVKRNELTKGHFSEERR